jgi:hypothetical protein
MSTFKDRMDAVRFNPGLMQQLALEELREQLSQRGNFDVPDPTNPFVYMLECATTMSAHAMGEGESLLGKVYPSLAVEREDLYRHMSDWDYLGRFAAPAWTTFDLYLSRDEVMAKTRPVGNEGVRQLTIPRLTEFTVADTTFTMQFPIHIRLMAHGGLQVVYDSDVTSPIQQLTTNLVDWDSVRLGGEELLVLHIPVGQFKIRTFTETLNQAAGYRNAYGFSDSFYTARVFVSRNGQWEEILTTHSEWVFDPTRLTAVLKVLEGQVEVRIPQIYFSQGMVPGEVRVDVYSTKGELELDLGSYAPDQFEYRLNAIDDDPTYTAPFKAFQRLQAISPLRVSGGSDAMPFVDLRDQVIQNALGSSTVPITSAQVSAELQRRGYSIVTNIDNITNRQFLATRQLPSPGRGMTSAGLGCLMGELMATFDELAASTHAVHHGEHITLLPSMLYEYRNGRVVPLLDGEIERIIGLNNDGKVTEVNNRQLLYTPLHYVLDGRNQRFSVRPYYLDQPEIIRKTLVGDNNSTQMLISVDQYQIERTPWGYQITVSLVTDERVDELDEEDVHVQLSYQPVGERTYASVMGTLIEHEGDERIYRFEIRTNYDIDANHRLRTTNLSMFDEFQVNHFVPLEHDFDLSFIVTGQDMLFYRRTELDDMVSQHFFDGEVMVVGRERLRIRLGSALTGLWDRSRTVVTELSYKRYPANVPYIHERTVLRTDEDGQTIITMDDEGNVQYEVLFEAGEPVLDEEGNVRIRHFQGDAILDANGEPELVEPRKLLREFTMLFFDGVYYVVDNQDALNYRQEIPSNLVRWLENDIGQMQEQLLEQSEIKLHPTKTLGETNAVVAQGLRSTLQINQHLFVNYYLTNTAYEDMGLRQSLLSATRRTVAEMVSRRTVSISDITTRLKALGGDSVINLDVGGLGGDNNFSIVSVDDDVVRLSLGARAALLPDQTITVQDDIDINFLKHQVS